MDRLKQALARARWHDRLVAVLFVDLDRFKNINDSLGHDIGDALLQTLATRLLGLLRDGDTLGRLGGDEFVLLLDDIAAVDDVNQLAQRILDAVAAPFSLGGETIHVSGSIGISQFPADGADATTLLKHADAAMYRAKEFGRNNFQFYSADMSSRAMERFTLENSLRGAFTRGEFLLHYQPQIDVFDGTVIGAEALLRWQHPTSGLIPPDKFIPLLEDVGLIVAVGEWVLQEGCRQLAKWHQRGWSELHMAVNLSSRQFDDADLEVKIREALASSGVDARYLVLEITETVMMRHGTSTPEKLRRLRALGVQIAIDDFGTGYSSLSYLSRLPVDVLKIDRSFIRDIPEDANDTVIAKTIIAMAQSLNLDLVAEGVETTAQREFLISQGCTLMQGFLLGRPADAARITELIELSVSEPDRPSVGWGL
jgi:diguanylate cyclase (GGDEF)-like protein